MSQIRHLPSYSSLATTDDDESVYTSQQRDSTCLDDHTDTQIVQDLPPAYDDVEAQMYNEDGEDRSSVRPHPKSLSTAQYEYGKRLRGTSAVVYILMLCWALLSSVLAVVSLFVDWVHIHSYPYSLVHIATSNAYGGLRTSAVLGLMCWAWIMQTFGFIVTALFLTARRDWISVRLALILHFMSMFSAFIAFILYSTSMAIFFVHMTAWSKDEGDNVGYGFGLVLLALTAFASFLHFTFGVGTLFGVNITLQFPSEAPLYIPMRTVDDEPQQQRNAETVESSLVVAPLGPPA